jgi:hypothetical protein
MSESIEYGNLILTYAKAKDDSITYGLRALRHADAGEQLMADACRRLADTAKKDEERLLRKINALRKTAGQG